MGAESNSIIFDDHEWP